MEKEDIEGEGLSMVVGPSDFEYDMELSRYGIFWSHLQRLGDERFLGVDIGVGKLDWEDGPSSYEYRAEVSYYFSRSLSISAFGEYLESGYRTGFFNTDGQRKGASLSYFLNSFVELELSHSERRITDNAGIKRNGSSWDGRLSYRF